MKKVFSLILALVLCLSLCACSGESADTPNTAATTEPTTEPPYPYPHLVETEWKDIFSNETMILSKDGTGTRNNVTIKWEVIGDSLFVTPVAGTFIFTTEYEIVHKDDIWRLVSKSDDELFVEESGYDYVFENERPVATITCHDGSVVKLTAKELYQLEKNNSGVFKQNYTGADITFIGTIKEISCEVYDSILWIKLDIIQFEEGWYLTLLNGEYTDLLLTLNPGDQLEVSSQIYSVTNADQIPIRGTYEDGRYSAESLTNTTIAVVEEEG